MVQGKHVLAASLALLVACAGPPPQRARPKPAVATPVQDRCLVRPTALALPLNPELPRDFLVANEAFEAGRALAEAGQPLAAMERFEDAVAADPGHGLAHLALAEAHLFTDNDVQAIRRHLATAVVLLPSNPRAHLRFANASAEANDPEAAVTHWRCALALRPELAEAHAQLARYLLAAGQPLEAEAEIQAALKAEPDAYPHHVLLADALEAQARPLDAARAVERAARLVGRSAALFRRAATLYDAARAEGDADEMRAEADRLDPPAEPRALRPLLKRRKRSR
ncbi:MAG: tetratricopeptide repeat protein [Myxococcales bacterium]|nr:tetratricopeptide repeat protein [Myxococcales bacterium]